MEKRRIGEDFKYVWSINWNGVPEDFSDTIEMVLTASIYGKRVELEKDVDYVVDGNLLKIDFTPKICTITGIYNLELNYVKPSDGFIDGERRSAVDIDAFQIVPKSAQITATGGITGTSDAIIGFYGLSAYEVWLKDNPESTKEDYYNWLRQPATDAVSLFDGMIEHLDEVIDSSTQNEAERVTAEDIRKTAEATRISAETERKANEVERLANESSRASDEIIREANESSRKQDEATRKTNENERKASELTRQSSESERDENEGLRAQAESLRATAESSRESAESLRVEAELLRQSSTQEAILNAEEATLNANNAATNADDAREAIQSDLSEYAKSGGSTKTLKEVEALSIKQNITDKSIDLQKGTQLTYSDSTIGNLGDDFTLSVMIYLKSTTFSTLTIIKKGDETVDGWAIYLDKSDGLFLRVKGSNYLISTKITQNNLFISVSSDINKTRVFVWGKEVLSIDALSTNIAIPFKIGDSAHNYSNRVYISYLSLDASALGKEQIKDEIDVILKPYTFADTKRDVVLNCNNITVSKWGELDNYFSGSVLIKDAEYPKIKKIEDDILANQLSTSSGVNAGLSESNLLLPLPANNQLSSGVTKLVDVSDWEQIEVINGVGSHVYYNVFIDSDNNVIKAYQTTTSIAKILIPSIMLDVPMVSGKVYGRFILGNDGYVIGRKRKTIPTPTIKKNTKKEIAGIDKVAPVIVDMMVESSVTKTPDSLKLFTPVSANASEMVMTAEDINLFSLTDFMYQIAVKDSEDTYHFANVYADIPNSKLLFEEPVSYTAVAFESLHSSLTSQLGQHLSSYASRLLGDMVVDSLSNYTSYKNIGSVGYVSADSSLRKNSDTSYSLIDNNMQEVSLLTTQNASVSCEQVTSNDIFSYKSGYAFAAVLRLRGEGTGLIAEASTSVPFKNGYIEFLGTTAIGNLNSHISTQTSNLIIENNGVEIYNKILKSDRHEKITLLRDDWGEVKVKYVVNGTGKYCIITRAIMFYKVDANQIFNTITENSTVAVLGDSWTTTPSLKDVRVGDDTSGYTRADTGKVEEDAQGYLFKRIASLTGATVDMFGQGGTTSNWGVERTFNILTKKKYSHIVILFFTNDGNQGMKREWESNLRLIIKIAMAHGVQPIIISPMGTSSWQQKGGHGALTEQIRRGLYEI